VSKKGCSWWAVLILMIATFLVAFFWGSSAASQKPVSTPVSAAVPVAPVVPVPPKVEPVPEPVKADPTPEPVKTSEPEKAPTPAPKVEPVKTDPATKVQPVDIEGISDDAWKSAKVVLRKDGSVLGIFITVSTGSTVVFHLPVELGVRDTSTRDTVVDSTGKSVVVASPGARLFPLTHTGNDGNGLIVGALGMTSFTPTITDGKIILTVPDPKSQKFAYDSLGEGGFGNFSVSFFSPQKFTEMSDKKLFVRLYLEWMARHPSRETNTDEPVDLQSWWDSLHQSAK